MNLVHREPDFENILRVLRREEPKRPTLFEFFMNNNLYQEATGRIYTGNSDLDHLKYLVDAYSACGYDYTNTQGCNISFNPNKHIKKETISLNEGNCIFDRESFEKFQWPEPSKCDYSRLEGIKDYLPGNMKLMVSGPGGVLENVIDLVGYDNLCIMLYEDEELAQTIFDKVGSILLEYYEICAKYESVGIIMSNDDWGFKTQTMLSPSHMRKYVFPWHKKIVECAHKNGKPAILHSCGYMKDVMDDIVYHMKYDGKHSYEDNIQCVEEIYKEWGGKIAILGGIDVDFLIRFSEEEITKRAKNMLELSKGKGGYALGSGNSIPDYIPNEKYFAMTAAVVL